MRRNLRDLGFKQSEFEARLTPLAEPRASGIDALELLFSPNPGEPLKPLRAIASSGEISRLMLAIKSSLAAQDAIPLLVFDEIDANVGGEIANAVGAKMRALASEHQVLCITHLPQVAAAASTHFVVTKEVAEGRTHSALARSDGQSAARRDRAHARRQNRVRARARGDVVESVYDRSTFIVAADSRRQLLCQRTARRAEPPLMKAIVAREYGGPEVLKLEEVPRPEPKEHEMLVRVIASGVNPADPLIVSGRFAKEFGTHLPLTPGYDVAGVVEKTGAQVTKFKTGDRVLWLCVVRRRLGGICGARGRRSGDDSEGAHALSTRRRCRSAH